MVKVSVIVPVYNVEQYLGECLDSIINQSLDDIEIICVDDCSADSSLDILYEYEKKDSRIVILKHETNRGAGASRNTGMKYASGEYIGFIDADDFVDRDMYLKLYEKSSEFDLDLLFFKMSVFDNETGEYDYNQPYYSLEKFNNFNKEFFTHNDTIDFTCELCVSPCACFYKRQFIMNFQFVEGMIFEDEPFFYNVYLNAKKVSLLKESFYFYRQNRKGSVMNKKDSAYMDVVKAFQLVRQAFTDSNNFTYLYRKFLYKRWFYLVLNRFSLVSDNNIKQEFFLKIKDDFKNLITSVNEFNLLTDRFKKDTLNVLFCDNYEEFENNLKIQNHNINEIVDEYKISIVVPVHNMEKHIHEAMNSIINQSFGFNNLEVLLVDDKSTDDTPNIINYYSKKYKNVKSIYLKENSGFAGLPRNIGIEYSSCDYVMFLDPDDLYEVNACEVLYREINAGDVDLVSGNYSDVEFNNSNKYNWSEKFGLNGDKFKVESVCENDKLLDVNPSIWTKIYRKEFLEKNNIRFPEKLPGQDLYFNYVTLFKAQGIIFIDESVVKYIARTNDNDLSVSCNNSKNVLIGLLEVYERLYNFLENYNSNYSWYVLKQLRYYWTERFINGVSDFSELKEIIDKASYLFKEYLKSNKIKVEIRPELFRYIANKQYLKAYSDLNVANTLISIIINPSDYREESLISVLDSLKKQSIGFDNLEIILLDNGNDIIEDFADDENVTLLLPDRNIAELYNKTIHNAKSDFILFLKPELTVKDNLCEILLTGIIEDNYDFVVGCNSEIFKDNKFSNLLEMNIISTVLFNRQFLLSNNLEFNISSNSEEIFFNKCLFKSDKLKYIDNPIFTFNSKNRKRNMKKIRQKDFKRYMSLKKDKEIINDSSSQKSMLNNFKSKFLNSFNNTKKR